MKDPTIDKATIEFFVAQKDPAVRKQAEQLIKDNKLPLKIVGDIVVEVGDSTEAWLARFVTKNEQMNLVKEKIRKLALVDDDRDQLFSVLIYGETGTGKEILARALHGDRTSDFLAINCAGLPENLVEAELFGYVEGAFTDAKQKREGLMRSAGTLFLDEIGELPMSAQAKLLRAIQSKKVRKVGSVKDEDIKCRIIAATHRNLKEMVKAGTFRLDLYARLSTFELDTIPLRDRPEDIEPILMSLESGKDFIKALQDKYGTFNDDFIQLLKYIEADKLELNVRELQQHVKRFKVLGEIPEV